MGYETPFVNDANVSDGYFGGRAVRDSRERALRVHLLVVPSRPSCLRVHFNVRFGHVVTLQLPLTRRVI